MYFEDYDIYFSESFGCILLGLTALALVQDWAGPQKPGVTEPSVIDAEGSSSNKDGNVEQAEADRGINPASFSESNPVVSDANISAEAKIVWQFHNEELGSTETTEGSGTGAATGVSSNVHKSATGAEVERDPYLAAIDFSGQSWEDFTANMGQVSSSSQKLCQCAQMHLRLLVEQLRTEANGDRAKFESLLVSKSSGYTKMIMYEGCDVFTLATLEGKFGQDSAFVELFKNIKHMHHTAGSSMTQKVPPYSYVHANYSHFHNPAVES